MKRAAWGIDVLLAGLVVLSAPIVAVVALALGEHKTAGGAALGFVTAAVILWTSLRELGDDDDL